MGNINIALNKPASSSSYLYPYAPQRAVDGSLATANRWLSVTLPAWMSVNLQGVYWIDKWTVANLGAANWPQNYNMNGYKLQSSMDNINWVDRDTVTGNASNSTTRTVAPFKASYVRLYVPGGQGIAANTNFASIAEFQVFQADPTSSYLSGLTISAGTLTPGFVKTTTAYTASVGFETSSITVTPTAEDSRATIKVNGAVVTSGQPSQAVNLNVGQNTITVQVTPYIGDPLNYTITVTRQDSVNLTNMVLKDTANNTIGISPAFTAGTTSYTANVEFGVASATVTPTAESSNAVITINGAVVQSGQASGVISLNAGATTAIPVLVTGYGGASKTYTIQVTRAIPDLYLSRVDLAFSGSRYSGSSSVTMNHTDLNYTANTSTKASSVTVTPYAEMNGVKINVNGQELNSEQASTPIALTGASTVLNLVVTYPNYTGSRNYTITVTRT
ncbi:MAG: cadherin-like beta sandwich domain-containing protein [Clostridia bacterium]|nr:cadherin-like beta sandwich domain-containing protein [Clostridia bacterium]